MKIYSKTTDVTSLEAIDVCIDVDAATGVVTGDTNYFRTNLMLAGAKFVKPGLWSMPVTQVDSFLSLCNAKKD